MLTNKERAAIPPATKRSALVGVSSPKMDEKVEETESLSLEEACDILKNMSAADPPQDEKSQKDRSDWEKYKNNYYSVPDSDEEKKAMNVAVNEHQLPGNLIFLCYTNGMGKAWELFEQMRESDRFCCIRFDTDYHYTYSISLFEDPRAKNCADPEAASKHEHSLSLRLDVANTKMSLLITVAYIWANNIKVEGVEMPWEKRERILRKEEEEIAYQQRTEEASNGD